MHITSLLNEGTPPIVPENLGWSFVPRRRKGQQSVELLYNFPFGKASTPASKNAWNCISTDLFPSLFIQFTFEFFFYPDPNVRAF